MVAGALALVAGLATAYLVRGERAEIEIASSTLHPSRSRELQFPAAEPARQPARPEPGDRQPVVGTEVFQEAPTAGPSSLGVELVEQPDQAPLAGATVLVRCFSGASEVLGAEQHVSADDGRAHFDLPEGTELVVVTVHDATVGTDRASWEGIPTGLVRLVIPAIQHVYGRVEWAGRPREGDDSSLEVVLSRDPGSDTPYFVGRSRAQAGEPFTLPACFTTPPGRLRFDVYHGTSLLLREDVEPTSCFQPPGVLLEIETRELVVIVRTRAGEPIPGAFVSVGVMPEASSEQVRLEATTDETGTTEIPLPGGSARICTGAPSFVTQCEVLESGVDLLEVVLLPVEPEFQVSVRTVDPSGAPIQGTVVSLFPDVSLDLGLRGVTQGRTDEHGRVRLPVSCGDPWLSAYHKDFLFVGPQQIHPRPGERYVLELESAGQLLLEPKAPIGAAPFRMGPLSWCAVDVQRQRSWSGVFQSPPYSIRDIPRGEYLVFVIYGETGLYGVARGTAGPTREVVFVVLGEGFRHEGQVLLPTTASNRDLLVWLSLPSLPDDITRRYCVANVPTSGAFSVFAGVYEAGDLSLWDGQTVLWRAPVNLLERTTIDLR